MVAVPSWGETLTGSVYVWCRHQVSGASAPITLHYPEGPKVTGNETMALEDSFIHSPSKSLLYAE